MKNELAKIQNLIHEIRGQKVMLDRDLADLYGVEVKRLNESVKRNIKRFPPEFMFQLSDEEWINLRSQIATFSKDTRKYKPFAFTEHGILMLSSVLNSDKAIEINIQIMKIFVRLRHYALVKPDTNDQIAELRRMLMLHIENTDYKLTEHGILMLSSVLNSDKAIEINIQIMEIFVHLRHYVLTQADTNEQIAELRKLLMFYIEKNDKRVNDIIIVLNNLVEQPKKLKTIGFNTRKE